jgi:hypothetical protein
MAFLLATIKFIVNTKWRRIARKKLPGLIYTNQLKNNPVGQTFVCSLTMFNIFDQSVMQKRTQTVQLLKEKLGQAVIDSTLLLTGLLKA